MARTAERLQRGGLWVLLVLLPFSKAAVELCFGALLIGWVLERLLPATRRRTVWLSPAARPLLVALVAYAVACALSIPFSDFPAKSVRGFFSKWVEYLLFFVIAADQGLRPDTVRRGVGLMAWSALAVVLLGLGQEVRQILLKHMVPVLAEDPAGAFDRMTGPYENPIDLATYFMVLIPVLLGLMTTVKGRRRWWLGGLVVLLIGCLGRTEALGAWLALGVGLGLLVVWEPLLRRSAGLVLGGVVLAAGAALLATGRLHTVSATDIGTTDRWLMWQAAARMIVDRPWLGHGVNTFMANYLDYWVGGERQPRYAHNCYLQSAAETGLIGLAAFAWLLILIVVRVMRGLAAAAGESRGLLAGCLAGLVAFVVQAGYDTNFYALRQAALFWVLAGLAVGLSFRCQEPSP